MPTQMLLLILLLLVNVVVVVAFLLVLHYYNKQKKQTLCMRFEANMCQKKTMFSFLTPHYFFTLFCVRVTQGNAILVPIVMNFPGLLRADVTTSVTICRVATDLNKSTPNLVHSVLKIPSATYCK